MCFYKEGCDEEFDNVSALAAHLQLHTPELSTEKAISKAEQRLE